MDKIQDKEVEKIISLLKEDKDKVNKLYSEISKERELTLAEDKLLDAILDIESAIDNLTESMK